MGQEAYNNKIIEQLDKLPDPEIVQIGCGDENNNEDEDEEEN